MDQPYPVRLTIDPIAEAIFEIRFKSDPNVDISEILPGLVFKSDSTKYPKFSSLPASQIPKQIRRQDPNLAYTPTLKMENDQFAIMIGENVCSLACHSSYVGWNEFKPKILELIDIILEPGLINLIERYSLKYINLIEPFDKIEGLNLLDSSIRIGQYDLNSIGCNLTIEIKNNDVINLVNIASSAKAIRQKEQKILQGLLLDIDSIYQPESSQDIESFKEIFDTKIDEVRENEKNIFFSVLQNETVSKYQPIYKKEPMQ